MNMAPKKSKHPRHPPVEEDDLDSVATATEMTRRAPAPYPTSSSTIQPDAGPSKPIRSPRTSSDRPAKQFKPGETVVNPRGDQNPNLMGVLALPYQQRRPRSGPPASSVRANMAAPAAQRPPSGNESAAETSPIRPQNVSPPQASSSRTNVSPRRADNVPPHIAAQPSISPQQPNPPLSSVRTAGSQSFAAASAQLQNPPALLPPFQVQCTLSAPESRSVPVSPGSSPPHPVEPAPLQDWVNWTLRAAALCQAIVELEKKL